MKSQVQIDAEVAAKNVEATKETTATEETAIAKVGGFLQKVVVFGLKFAVKTIEFGGAVAGETLKKVGGILAEQFKAVEQTTEKHGVLAGVKQTFSGFAGGVVGTAVGAGLTPIVAANTAAIMPAVLAPIAPVVGLAAGAVVVPAVALGGLVTGVTYHKEIGAGVATAATMAKDGVVTVATFVSNGISNKIHDSRVNAAKNTQTGVEVDYSENDNAEEGFSMLMLKDAKDAKQASSNIEMETAEPKATIKADLQVEDGNRIKVRLI
jgi:uncharacterized membrane protein YhiD involved in acid resistance